MNFSALKDPNTTLIFNVAHTVIAMLIVGTLGWTTAQFITQGERLQQLETRSSLLDREYDRRFESIDSRLDRIETKIDNLLRQSAAVDQ